MLCFSDSTLCSLHAPPGIVLHASGRHPGSSVVDADSGSNIYPGMLAVPETHPVIKPPAFKRFLASSMVSGAQLAPDSTMTYKAIEPPSSLNPNHANFINRSPCLPSSCCLTHDTCTSSARENADEGFGCFPLGALRPQPVFNCPHMLPKDWLQQRDSISHRELHTYCSVDKSGVHGTRPNNEATRQLLEKPGYNGLSNPPVYLQLKQPVAANRLPFGFESSSIPGGSEETRTVFYKRCPLEDEASLFVVLEPTTRALCFRGLSGNSAGAKRDTKSVRHRACETEEGAPFCFLENRLVEENLVNRAKQQLWQTIYADPEVKASHRSASSPRFEQGTLFILLLTHLVPVHRALNKA